MALLKGLISKQKLLWILVYNVNIESANCPICTNEVKPSENVNKLTVKGVATILDASIKRKNPPIHTTVGQQIHFECRRKNTHPREIEKYLKTAIDPHYTNPSKRLRSKQIFNYQSNCLFCARFKCCQNGEGYEGHENSMGLFT